MTTAASQIIEHAMMLSEVERAAIADHLMKSLAPPLDPDEEAALIVEMERRWQEVETGAVELLDQEQVLAEARGRYGW
jgi:putative addiction module component (TIGR02574 family)